MRTLISRMRTGPLRRRVSVVLSRVGAGLAAMLAVVVLAPSAQAAPGNAYWINNGQTLQISSYDGGYVIDVEGQSRSEGADVVSAIPVIGGSSQQWRAWLVGYLGDSRVYEFHNVNSGYVLDVERGNRSGGLTQWRDQNSNNQRWMAIQGQRPGEVRLINVSTGEALGMPHPNVQLMMELHRCICELHRSIGWAMRSLAQ
jgi:ricin-type beta-trefoil lectin protein